MELLAGTYQFGNRSSVESSKCVRGATESVQFSVDILQRELATVCGGHRLGKLRRVEAAEDLIASSARLHVLRSARLGQFLQVASKNLLASPVILAVA